MTAVTGPRWFAAAPRRARAVALPAALTLVVAWLSWPSPGLQPSAGLDGSWMIGLSLAFRDGLDFGSDVVFTYGPLGFLRSLVAVDPWALRLSFVWVTLMHLTLVASLLWTFRGGLRSWWLAAPCAFVVAVLQYEGPVVIGLIFAVALIAGRVRNVHAATAMSALFGAATGLELLDKLNAGVVLAGLVVVTAATARLHRRRIAQTLAVTVPASAALAWLVTGQAVGDVPGFVSGALAVSSGYANGMVVTWPGKGWHLVVAFGLGLLGAVIAYRSGAGLPRRARVGLVLAWAGFFFLAFKSGFVRHGPGHTTVFTATIIGGFAAYAWAMRSPATLALGLLPLVFHFSLGFVEASRLYRVDLRAKAFATEVATLSDGSATNEEIESGRAAIRKVTAVPPEIVALLQGHTVSVEPWETSIAYAYRLNWKPLPVFQSYAAYTRTLDERNAQALSGGAGPERILRMPQAALDGRNEAWDPPAAARAMLCHYRPIGLKDAWQVLERGANRCGAAREVSRVDARLGEAVPVPAAGPGELLYVEIDGFGLGLAEKLRTLLYRSVTRTVTLDEQREFRVPPEIVGDGLLLRVPVDADYAGAPFAVDQNPRTITLERGSGEQPDDTVGLRFMSAPIEPVR